MIQLCRYEQYEALDDQTGVRHDGQALVVNASAEGLLLFMKDLPAIGELMHVYLQMSADALPVLVEVRWARAVTVDVRQAAHFVGVQIVHGPYLVWEPLGELRGISVVPLKRGEQRI